MQDFDFQTHQFDLSFNNFDPDLLTVDQTINAVFVVDISPSVATYIKELNHAFNDFICNMQQSHLSDQLMVSVLTFNEKVKVKTGFQPITSLKSQTFKPSGSGTALFDATKQGLDIALNYRQSLRTSGVLSKTLLFVITDGHDNSSVSKADQIKKQLQKIKADEANTLSFMTLMFGVGNDASFENAKNAMGLDLLARIGQSADQIRAMLGIVSQSIAAAPNGQMIHF